MTSPLSPEAVAQMVARLRTRGQHQRAAWDDGDMEFTAADMLTTLAAENATLRAERDLLNEQLDAAETELGRVIMSCPPGMRKSPASDGVKMLRASEAAALERVKVLNEALEVVAEGHPKDYSDNCFIARAAIDTCQALTPTADKE